MAKLTRHDLDELYRLAAKASERARANSVDYIVLRNSSRGIGVEVVATRRQKKLSVALDEYDCYTAENFLRHLAESGDPRIEFITADIDAWMASWAEEYGETEGEL